MGWRLTWLASLGGFLFCGDDAAAAGLGETVGIGAGGAVDVVVELVQGGQGGEFGGGEGIERLKEPPGWGGGGIAGDEVVPRFAEARVEEAAFDGVIAFPAPEVGGEGIGDDLFVEGVGLELLEYVVVVAVEAGGVFVGTHSGLGGGEEAELVIRDPDVASEGGSGARVASGSRVLHSSCFGAMIHTGWAVELLRRRSSY